MRILSISPQWKVLSAARVQNLHDESLVFKHLAQKYKEQA